MPSIVVVAKCPVPGHCKTRLIPLLGLDGSAKLAHAMLSDVLACLSDEFPTVSKTLLYAPPTSESRQTMRKILHFVGDGDSWMLLPVEPLDVGDNGSDISSMSSYLTPILTNALIGVREAMSTRNDSGPVVFLGMDSPQLNLEELVLALYNTDDSAAHICPCPDGGYGMISLPSSIAAEKAFCGVQWSHSLTTISQIKALTDADANVRIKMGRLMYDIDEPGDVYALCRRLEQQSEPHGSGRDQESSAPPMSHILLDGGCLFHPSSPDGVARTSDCPRTRQALAELKLLSAARVSDAGKSNENS